MKSLIIIVTDKPLSNEKEFVKKIAKANGFNTLNSESGGDQSGFMMDAENNTRRYYFEKDSFENKK